MRPLISFAVAAMLALTGCAAMKSPDPARSGHTVSLVNSLSWTNAVSGKPDALRTAWPLAALTQHTEHFPLAQVTRCNADGTCGWGVLKAYRIVSAPRYVAGGVALELELGIDVDRRHEAVQDAETMALTIPADVVTLQAKRTVRKSLVLQYGKVEHIDLDFGIGYAICVQRLDAGAMPVDSCDIPFI